MLQREEMKNQKANKITFYSRLLSTLGASQNFTLWYSVSLKEIPIYNSKIIRNFSSGLFLYY